MAIKRPFKKIKNFLIVKYSGHGVFTSMTTIYSTKLNLCKFFALNMSQNHATSIKPPKVAVDLRSKIKYFFSIVTNELMTTRRR